MFTPRGQTSPLEANFTPRGKLFVKNWPQVAANLTHFLIRGQVLRQTTTNYEGSAQAHWNLFNVSMLLTPEAESGQLCLFV
jgi:uncharacterized ferritin-like protein (DUF455 family)